MAIVKIIKRENPYIQIDKTGINDTRLSWGATGLLTYLIGRPDDWKINLNHLSTVKDRDKKDKTRGYLNELREFEYCHYFEIRKAGKIIENFYLIFEVPTKYEGILENLIEIPENCTVHYKGISKQKKEKESKKSIENKEVSPQLEKPISATPTSVNPTLLIKEYTKERNTNNRTTTKDIKNDLEKDKKISSSYDFLDKNIFNLLNNATKKNIRKNIKDLTEEKFTKIYNLTLECIKQGKGQNFNAVLYKGLNNEWEYTTYNIKTEESKLLDENKKKWLSYFAGINSDKSLKSEVESIIINIPIEVLNTNKNTLARMNTFEFKQHLLFLRKKC
ncbi:hypothetical protein [Fusobacterium ulcerans]